MTTGWLLIVVGAFCFGIPQKLARLVSFLYKGLIFKMTFHYLEYSYFGKTYTTWQEGPLNDLLGSGLLNEIGARGGKVIFHQQGSKDFVLEVMNERYDDAKSL